jgi:hypothetical protein
MVGSLPPFCPSLCFLFSFFLWRGQEEENGIGKFYREERALDRSPETWILVLGLPLIYCDLKQVMLPLLDLGVCINGLREGR